MARNLQKETRKVSFEQTGSELAALLKEKFELRSNKPKLNKKKIFRGFSYGVYAKEINEGHFQFLVEKANGQPKRLSSFLTLKASKNFLKKLTATVEQESDAPVLPNKTTTELLNAYSTQNRNIMLLDKGRELGEKSVFLIKNGVFQGFGYAELNYQINNIPILESIITPMQGDDETTYIIESYLRIKRLRMVELDQ